MNKTDWTEEHSKLTVSGYPCTVRFYAANVNDLAGGISRHHWLRLCRTNGPNRHLSKSSKRTLREDKNDISFRDEDAGRVREMLGVRLQWTNS